MIVRRRHRRVVRLVRVDAVTAATAEASGFWAASESELHAAVRCERDGEDFQYEVGRSRSSVNTIFLYKNWPLLPRSLASNFKY